MSGQQTQKPYATRWTAWELLLLGVSVIMITFPVFVTGYALVTPTTTSAAESIESRVTSTLPPSGFTPTASSTRTPIPSATSSPTATSTATATNTTTPTLSPSNTSTATETATATIEATGTATPSSSETPTVTAETATAAPTVDPTAQPAALRLKIKALSASGYPISVVRRGDVFVYYIEVAHDVDNALEVELHDVLPDQVTSPHVLNVVGGTCGVDGQTLDCTLTPRRGAVSTVALQVTMGYVPDGTVITNSVTVRSLLTGESADASLNVSVLGGPTATPTVATETAVAPTATTEAPTPTTPVPATATDVPSAPATTITEPTTTGPTSVPRSNKPRDDEPTPTNPPMLPVTVSPVGELPSPTTMPTDVVVVPVEPSVVPSPDPVPTTATVPTSTAVGIIPTEPATVVPTPVGDAAPTVQHPVLRRGATGPAVSELQSLLNAWIAQTRSTGIAPLVVDGIFGPATDMAVRAFQAVAGLTVDGIVGPQTWASLEAFDDAEPVVAPPAPTIPVENAPALPPVAPAAPTALAPTTSVEQSVPVQLAPTPTFAPTMVPVATALPTTAPRSNVALRFNVGSGTSEAAPGDLVMFTITLRHAGRGTGGSAPIPAAQLGQPPSAVERQGETIRDVMLVDELSPALEVFAVNSVGITVRQNGRWIEASRDTLEPGDAAVIVIGTRVRNGIDLPTIANQASLRYSSLAGAIYSNVAEVRVSGVQQPAPTPIGASTSAPTGTAAIRATPVVSNAGATPQAGGGAETVDSQTSTAFADLGTQLPTTSGGVPLGGIVLLGLTLLLHSLRVRAERTARG